MAVRKGMRRRAGRHGLAGLAALGAVVVGGVVAGWGVTPVETREITPAEVVDLRFPADWNDDQTGSAPPAPAAGYALASADSQPADTAMLFNPHPTLMAPASIEAPMPMSTAVEQADAKADVLTQPDPEPKAPLKLAARADAQPEARTAPARSVVPAPERHVAPPPRKDSGTPFNDAQLASIKHRLKLSPYQEQYWPQVAAALHDIGSRAGHDNRAGGAHGNARLAAIDPDGPEVQRLKSAAFPLIMSMNDEQKREVRMIAQVMGLDSVAASF